MSQTAVKKSSWVFELMAGHQTAFVLCFVPSCSSKQRDTAQMQFAHTEICTWTITSSDKVYRTDYVQGFWGLCKFRFL